MAKGPRIEKKAIEFLPGSSTRLETFEQIVAENGYQVETEIQQILRYKDIVSGKERVRYVENRKAIRGDGELAVSCNVRRNWPYIGQMGELEERHPKEWQILENDKTSKEFDWNATNVKRIRGMTTPTANLLIQPNMLSGEKSTIKNPEHFWTLSFDELVKSLQSDAKDLAQSIRELIGRGGA